MAVELGSSSIAQELAMQAGISLHEPTALRRDHTVGLEVRSRRWQESQKKFTIGSTMSRAGAKFGATSTDKY